MVSTLCPWGKNTHYPWTRTLGVLESRSENYVGKKSVDPAGDGSPDVPALSLVTIEY